MKFTKQVMDIIPAIVVMIMLFFGAELFFLDNSFQRWRATVHQKQLMLLEIAQKKVAAATDAKIQQSLLQFKQENGALIDLLATHPSSELLSQQLTDMAQQSALTISHISTTQSHDSIDIKALGNYFSLLRFLYAIDHHPWPFTLTALRIPSAGTFVMTVDFRGFNGLMESKIGR